jgi:hypothetical protein
MGNDYVRYELHFRDDIIQALDEIAQKACHSESYGNDDNWLLSFRMGKIGLYARLMGVRSHFEYTHSIPNDQVSIEYHVGCCLFCMDSAIECYVYMLNALGYGVNNNQFRSIRDAKQLRKIDPLNVIGDPEKHKTRIVSGYNLYFPRLKSYMRSKRLLVNIIMELHNVSKHRRSVFAGGNRDVDMAKKMSELTNTDVSDTILLAPYKTIITENDPRSLYSSTFRRKSISFEKLVINFTRFINKCFTETLFDVKTNIDLSPKKRKAN